MRQTRICTAIANRPRLPYLQGQTEFRNGFSMNPFVWLLDLLIDIAIAIVVIQAVMSWLIHFGVLDIRQRLVRSVWDTLNRLTDPVFGPIRRYMPDLGGIDITPMVLIIVLLFLQRLVYAYLV